MLICRRRIL